MSVLAFLLVLISAFLHALKNFLVKGSQDKQVFTWYSLIVGLVLLLPFFLRCVDLHELYPGPSLYLCLLSGFVHFLYILAYTKSYEDGDSSHVYPIMRSSPALVLVFAIVVLNEDVSFAGATGILLVAFGAYAVNLKSLAFSELLEPIRALGNERATQFAFLTMLAVTAYSIIDKAGVRQINPVTYMYLFVLLEFVLLTLYIAWTKSRAVLSNEWEINQRAIAVNGCIITSGYLLILLAFELERVSYVVGLRQISVVFAVLIGGFVLKEHHKAIRLFASTIIFIGAMLITSAS